MKCYEPFAGIAGIGLGLESIGWETAAFSEYDPAIAKKNGRQYAADVMRARFPSAADCGDIQQLEFLRGDNGAYIGHLGEEIPVVHEDVEGAMRKRTKLYEGPIDIVAGGFPCTDISSAGKQAGITGERSGLWKDMLRAIDGLRPKGVLIENVAALAGRGLDVVLKDLAEIGYDCEWDVIGAAGVGAPHLRERLFIIAWPHGEGHHGPWPEPPVYDNWLTEPPDVPRLIQDGIDRPARLRCLGNAVVPQVAAHVAGLLRDRITGEHSQSVAENGQWDATHKRGEKRGLSKCVGHALPFGPMCNGETAPPTLPTKLPRAGRMTQGDVYERERSCTQRHAKQTGLAHMAATLRPHPADHPELPHTGLVPTPNASVANDGEGADTWIERKLHHASKDENPTRASMPLSIYAQVKLVPTPTAKDADSSRSRTAVRDTPPARESQMGETLTDFVDPTNGGRLLPTPRAADGEKNVRSLEGARAEVERKGLGGVDLDTATRLLPTPTASMQTEQDMMQAMYRSDNPDRPAYSDATFAKLLPTPCAADANGSRASKGADRPDEGGLLHHAKLLPTPTSADGAGGAGHGESMQGAPSLRTVVSQVGTGRLNPIWVLWLMGFPLDWFDGV